MLFVEGIGFQSRAEYEQALLDKKIIDELRSKYDLTTKEGLLGVSKELRSVHFQTKVGDNFDDEVFEKLEAVKRGVSLKPAEPVTPPKTPRKPSAKSKAPAKPSLAAPEKPIDKEKRKKK